MGNRHADIMPSMGRNKKLVSLFKKKNKKNKKQKNWLISLHFSVATVGDLEDALNKQAKLVSQLTTECQSLTQRLEVNNIKHKYIF